MDWTRFEENLMIVNEVNGIVILFIAAQELLPKPDSCTISITAIIPRMVTFIWELVAEADDELRRFANRSLNKLGMTEVRIKFFSWRRYLYACHHPERSTVEGSGYLHSPR